VLLFASRSFRSRGSILLVLKRRRLAERNIAHNRELKTFKCRYLGGMIRKEQDPAQPKGMENLGPHTVTCFQTRVSFTDSLLLHEVVRTQLIDQVQTMFALAQIETDAARRSRDLLERRM